MYQTKNRLNDSLEELLAEYDRIVASEIENKDEVLFCNHLDDDP